MFFSCYILVAVCPCTQPESEGAKLNALMKTKVREDVGHLEDVNRAVHGTCAALLKHHGQVKAAMNYARGKLANPEPSVVKVLRIFPLFTPIY